MKSIKALLPALMVAFFLVFGAACGDESTSESCESSHDCVNGVCECTTEGKDGESCEEDTCEEECEVCE